MRIIEEITNQVNENIDEISGYKKLITDCINNDFDIDEIDNYTREMLVMEIVNHALKWVLN